MRDGNHDSDRGGPPSGDPPLPDGNGLRGVGLGLLDRMNNYLLLIYAGACLLMNYSIAGILYLRGMTYPSIILPGLFAILGPLYLLTRRSGLGFVREFGFERPSAGVALAGLAVALSSILPIEAFSALFERTRPPDADYISFILSIKPKGPESFALAALGVAIVGPIGEELLFRGFVQRIFARNMSGALAVALAGVLFGLSHFSIAVLPGVVALGVLYGYIYHATRSLWCPIMAHAVFNFSSLLRLHAATEEEIISAAVELPGIALTLLSLAACVVSLGLLRRAARAGGFHRRRA